MYIDKNLLVELANHGWVMHGDSQCGGSELFVITTGNYN